MFARPRTVQYNFKMLRCFVREYVDLSLLPLPCLSLSPFVLPSIHPPYLQPSLPLSSVRTTLSTYLQPSAHLSSPSLPPSSNPSSNCPSILPSIPLYIRATLPPSPLTSR